MQYVIVLFAAPVQLSIPEVCCVHHRKCIEQKAQIEDFFVVDCSYMHSIPRVSDKEPGYFGERSRTYCHTQGKGEKGAKRLLRDNSKLYIHGYWYQSG